MSVTWIDLEEQWLRDGKHVYFAPEDEAGIGAFEQHLRSKRLRFVVHNRADVPAVVFARPSRDAHDAAAPHTEEQRAA